MSKYDKTFYEKEFALYDYNATYNRVTEMFSKYRSFKNTIREFYGKIGSTSRVFGEKVCESNHTSDQTSRYVEQIIYLKNFIDYCEIVIKAHIKELNYYEKWILDDVLIGGKKLISIENDCKCERGHNYLTNAKKSCILKVSLWFDIYVLNDSLFEELKKYKGCDM